MARKDLLKSLMDPEAPDAPGRSPGTLPPRSAKGAIGAVSQSIAELKKRALIEVPADMIDMAGLRDRLDEDPAALAALVESLRLYGQQVPVLLRHSPNVEGRYEVVYGRRRVAALRQLGLPVRAMLRDLNDADLIIAQGQENSARKDLSFIEKAAFARQMLQMKFSRKVIGDALHLDKTVISRMLSIVEALPDPLIEAIGAAPSAGRDRWRLLSERAAGHSVEALCAMAQGESSDARFEAVFAALAPKPAKVKAPAPLTGTDGSRIGSVTPGRGRVTLVIETPDLGEWMAENMDEIHRRFLAERGE